MIPNHPFIRLTTHPSIHPPHNHTNTVEDCSPRSIHTQELLQRTFFFLMLWEKKIILLSKWKKICWRSWCVEKQCALPGICECWVVRDSHPCDLARVVSKVTKARLCDFPYPMPTLLNPIYTSSPAQIPLHPQSPPWFSSPIRHTWTWTSARMSLWHLWWHVVF